MAAWLKETQGLWNEGNLYHSPTCSWFSWALCVSPVPGQAVPQVIDPFSQCKSLPRCICLMEMCRAACRTGPGSFTVLLAQKLVDWANRNPGWKNMHKPLDFCYQNVLDLTFLQWPFQMNSALGTFIISEKTSVPLSLPTVFSFHFLLSLLHCLFRALATLLSSSSCSKSQIWTEMCLVLLLQLGTLPFTWAGTAVTFNIDTQIRRKSDAKDEGVGRAFCITIQSDVHYIGCIFFLFKN